MRTNIQIVNHSDFNKIDSISSEIIVMIMSEIIFIWQERIKHIFLAGSVARGDNLPKISDLDLLVIVKDLNQDLEIMTLSKIDNIQKKWGHHFSNIDISFHHPSLDVEANSKLNFILQTDAICLYPSTENLRNSSSIPIEYLSKYLMISDLDSLIAQFEYIASHLSSNGYRILCRKFSKIIIRHISGIILSNEELFLRSASEVLCAAHQYLPNHLYTDIDLLHTTCISPPIFQNEKQGQVYFKENLVSCARRIFIDISDRKS